MTNRFTLRLPTRNNKSFLVIIVETRKDFRELLHVGKVPDSPLPSLTSLDPYHSSNFLDWLVSVLIFVSCLTDKRVKFVLILLRQVRGIMQLQHAVNAAEYR